MFNIYPTSLHAQYRFSTKNKESLPLDLTSQTHLNTMLALLQPLVVPPLLASGVCSACKMKTVLVQIFNKNDKSLVVQDGKVCTDFIIHSMQFTVLQKVGGAGKGPVVINQDRPKTDTDVFHEHKVQARIDIIGIFQCNVHSLPDKPVTCFKDPQTGLCYPITEQNLNLWATLHVRKHLFHLHRLIMDHKQVRRPDEHPLDKVPQAINIYANGPHTRTPAQHQHAPAQQVLQPPPSFPYGYYTPHPFGMVAPPGWPVQTMNQPITNTNPGQLPPPLAPAPLATGVKYPLISAWLQHCDKHPGHSGEDFSRLLPNFDKEGYRQIQQLTGDRITVEKLAEWIGIGRGTADLLIHYAIEDVELVRAGSFVMLSNTDTA
jgi:hypothetical protein